MSLKDKIEKGGEWHPARMVIYGAPKCGKTSTASDAPNPLFLGQDDGRRRLSVDGYPIPHTWADFTEQLTEATKEAKEAGYKSIVIDTLNGVIQLCAEHVCETQFGGRWNDPRNGFLSWGGAQGWSSVSEEIKPMLNLLNNCVDQGLWVILICHQKIDSVKNPIIGDYQRFAPDMDRRVWARIAQWSDVILRVDYRIATDKEGNAINDEERVFNCSASVAEEGGCRIGYELPEELPFSWQSIEDHIGKTDPAIFDTLRDLWKSMDKEQTAKAIEYLGVTAKTITDAPAHKIKALINRLQQGA